MKIKYLPPMLLLEEHCAVQVICSSEDLSSGFSTLDDFTTISDWDDNL